MADISVDTDNLVSQDDNKNRIDIDVESEDNEDYSSGSDRSLEAEDSDIRCESGEFGTPDKSQGLADRRKLRHGSHGSRRHKGGSRHKIKGFQNFHPYLDSAEELAHLKRKSQELKEKETAAAVVRQEGESHFMNFPIAPFNSTQFLMEQHDGGSPRSSTMHRSTSSSQFTIDSPMLHSVASTPAESQLDSSSNCERKDKEFTDIYATVHAESLQSLPKDELVKNYMSLEEKVAILQKKVAEAEAGQQLQQNDDSGETHAELTNGNIGNSSLSASTVIPEETTKTFSSKVSTITDSDDISSSVSRPTICVGDPDSASSVSTGSNNASNGDVAL